jgi:hypothetical protein
MSRYLSAVAALVLTVVCALALSRAGSSEDTPPGGGAMVGYRDPATGEFGLPPADVAAQLNGAALQRAARPVERRGTSPAGGVLLDGGPMMGMVATVGADGQVNARCGSRP